MVHGIVALRESPSASVKCPPQIHQIPNDFKDIMSNVLYDGLAPIKYIQYAFGFVPRYLICLITG